MYFSMALVIFRGYIVEQTSDHLAGVNPEGPPRERQLRTPGLQALTFCRLCQDSPTNILKFVNKG